MKEQTMQEQIINLLSKVKFANAEENVQERTLITEKINKPALRHAIKRRHIHECRKANPYIIKRFQEDSLCLIHQLSNRYKEKNDIGGFIRDVKSNINSK